MKLFKCRSICTACSECFSVQLFVVVLTIDQGFMVIVFVIKMSIADSYGDLRFTSLEICKHSCVHAEGEFNFFLCDT